MSDTRSLTIDVHLKRAGRDSGGRFASGNPGKPPGATSRLRNQVSRLLITDFIGNHEQIMARLRADHVREYLQLMLQLMNEADPSAEGDGEAPRLNVENICTEAVARRETQRLAEEAQLEAWINEEAAQLECWEDAENEA